MVWVACVVCGWCCVLVVFCMACSSHHFVHTKPPPLSPFPLPSPPHSSVSLCVWKRVWTTKWMVWNGVWCVAYNTSATVLSSSHHQPLCVSGPSPFPSHSQTPSLPSLVVLVCLDRKSEGQVWDSPCQTHCAPHPIHTTLFPSNHAPFSMSTWLIGL